MNTVIQVLSPLYSRDYDFLNKEGKQVKGTSHKQDVRYKWGENSVKGIIKIRDMGGVPEHAGFPAGEYTISPDSFDFKDGMLELSAYVQLVPVPAARKAA